MNECVVRVTTNQGIEDVAARETVDRLHAAGFATSDVQAPPPGLAGIVTATVSSGHVRLETVWDALRGSRSVYHVVVHVGETVWNGQTLNELAEAIADLPLELMARAGSFRVSCSRVGNHPFHSPDVERAVGAALQARFRTPVDLENYEVNVRVDIVENRCLCGYQLSAKKGLDRRYAWKYHPRVTLRTTVAWAMLRISGYLEQPGRLLDPFCGSGTILMEAASVAVPDNPPEISGSDIRASAVDGCRRNLEAAGFSGRVTVVQADAREMTKRLAAASIDYIVTNPPFGIRMASHANFTALYGDLLAQAAVVLKPGGVLALLVGRRRGRFNKVLQATEAFQLEHVRIIEIGGVFPGLFVLRRVSGPA